MTKKWHEEICKCAEIRKNDDDGCPFGLRIPFGCKMAGDAVDRMASLKILGDEASDEEKQTLAKANKRMLNWTILGKTTEEPGQCKYAAKIFPDKQAVECNYEDTAPGVGQQSITMAAPFYSQVFSGIGLNGLYSYPIGYYADYNISRNLFYGLYSLQGGEDLEMLCKIAILAKSGQSEAEYTSVVARQPWRIKTAISHLLRLHFRDQYGGAVNLSPLQVAPRKVGEPDVISATVTIPAAEYYAQTSEWNDAVAEFLGNELPNAYNRLWGFQNIDSQYSFSLQPDRVQAPPPERKPPPKEERPVVRPASTQMVNLARQLPPEILEKFEAWYVAASRNQGSDRVERYLLAMEPARFIAMFTDFLQDIPLAEVYERSGGE